MTDITFNDLPKAVSQIIDKLNNLETLIKEKIGASNESDHWFNINELCDYLPAKPQKSTVYGWVQHRQIPFHKEPNRKALSFLKSEIDQWLMRGEKRTISDIQSEAHFFLNTRTYQKSKTKS